MEVFILTVQDKDFGIVELEVFTTEEKANEHLAKYVRECWDEDEHMPGEMPHEKLQAIKRFFDYWTEELWYTIEAKILDLK